MSRFIAVLALLAATCAVPTSRGEAAATDQDAGPLPREWSDQFDELDRQIRTMRAWFERVQATTYRGDSLIVAADRDPVDVVLRRTEALLAHLKGKLAAGGLEGPEAELTALKGRCATTDAADVEARRRLHEALCRVRRKIAFANPLLSFDRILFIKRHRARANHMCDQYFGFMVVPGGGVCVLEGLFGPRPTVRELVGRDGPAVCENGRFRGQKLLPGGFLSPDLSYDGKTVLFAYTEAAQTGFKWSEQSTWHLFRLDIAPGSPGRLRQLTDGKVDDFDPCWLPDGRIAFISERRGGFGRCHARPVPLFTLHAMNADGGDIVTISANEANEWHPSVDHHGMIVYTRWDYVDRGHQQAHHPWLTTPDGRDARAVHGNFKPNQGVNPLMEMDLRAIPGSNRYVATAAAHHDQAYGSLVMIDPDVEDDDRMAPVRRITPEVAFPEAERGGQQVYAAAWPLDEDFYLCVYDAARAEGRSRNTRYGIYLLDTFGNKELLYRDESISCLSPIPLRARPTPPVVASLTEPLPPPDWVSPAAVRAPGETPKPAAPAADSQPLSPVAVMNVYDGLLPWPKGTVIKALRIVQILPKASPIHNEPFIGYGTDKGARAVLGTVPVEADGSAHFLLPAGKCVYFQALDERGLAVQSMRSATYVHPGQRLSCQGCHDRRSRAPAPPKHVPQALRRDPSAIRPDVDGSNPFSFPRLVQPVLARNCVPCHTKNPGKAPDLTAGDWEKDKTRQYASYRNLQKYAFFFAGRTGYGYDGWTTPRTIPGQCGARASKLLAMLDGGHNKVKLAPEDLHRLTLWLDCQSDFFGSFENVDAQCRGEAVKPALE